MVIRCLNHESRGEEKFGCRPRYLGDRPVPKIEPDPIPLRLLGELRKNRGSASSKRIKFRPSGFLPGPVQMAFRSKCHDFISEVFARCHKSSLGYGLGQRWRMPLTDIAKCLDGLKLFQTLAR
jgi:hypothetical protein